VPSSIRGSGDETPVGMPITSVSRRGLPVMTARHPPWAKLGQVRERDRMEREADGHKRTTA